MRFLTFLTILICSLSFSVKSYSQIEIFGVSFGMNHEEILLEFDRKGYHGFYQDDFEIPTPCIQNGRVVQGECFQTLLSPQPWKDICNSQLKSMDECSLRTGSKDHCSVELDQMFQCLGEVFSPPSQVFMWLESEVSNTSPKYDYINFECEVFNGCSYTTKEIVRFLSDNLRDQLVQASGSVVVEEWEGLDYCLSGLKGDKICVEQSGGYNEIGLYRDQYGRPSMTLSLN